MQDHIIDSIRAENIEKLSELIADNKIKNSVWNHCFKFAAQHGYIESVKLLLSTNKVDPSTDDNFAIKYAAKIGHANVVKLLLNCPAVDPAVLHNYPIRSAIDGNKIETVKLLLADPRTNFLDAENEAVISAITKGHTDMITLLFTHFPVDQNWYAELNEMLSTAVFYNRIEIVKILLKDYRSDPSIDNNHILNLAKKNNNVKIIELLTFTMEKNIIFGDKDLTSAERIKKLLSIGSISLDDAKIEFGLCRNERISTVTFNL